MFRVGQKVVCINNAVAPGYRWGGDAPAMGDVYTIVSIEICEHTHLGQIGFLLREITNAHNAPYAAARFRPAVERKTDISIFKRMLTPQQESERV